MSGQQSRSSKRIQGIAASPPLPLATRRTATQSEPVETERTAPRTDPGENLGKISAENSAKQKYKFTSQAGKSHPCRDQEAASSADATRSETGAVQRNDGKRSAHQGRDSGFADKSQVDCTTWESPTTKTTQAAPRKPTHEEGDRSSQGSRPSLTWDTSDLAVREDLQYQTPTKEGEDEAFADEDLFSPARNIGYQTATDDDEDELYTPVRLWAQRAADQQPEPRETEISYAFLS